MSNKKRLPVKGKHRQEADRGQKLKDQGDRDFESVYGPKIPGTFNISEDINAMDGVIAMNEETKNLISTVPVEQQEPVQEQGSLFAPAVAEPTVEAMAAAGFNLPKVDTQMPDIPVKNIGPEPPPAEPEEDNDEDEKKPLTLEEKLQKLSNFVKDITGHEIPVNLLKSWKSIHGSIHMLHLGERVFLFRYLKRQEMLQMKANPQYEEMTEDKRDEEIYHKCLLYPKLDTISESGDAAGVMSLIANQVKLNSLFLDEMYVAQMVVKI